MFMPAVFHENLFDDLFDPFWNDGALERAMNREERETFGKRGANMMKTDVKQTENGYDVAVDLPGCKKEDVQMELNDGYLTIQAVRSHSNDEKDNNGRYIRRETFSGTCARSFYVGDAVMFGPNVTISTTGHPVHPYYRMRGAHFSLPVVIEDGVWIGANVVVMPGVTIGKNSVIGAGSVVTRDIPENVVAFGTPCRVIRPITDADLETIRPGMTINADWNA